MAESELPSLASTGLLFIKAAPAGYATPIHHTHEVVQEILPSYYEVGQSVVTRSTHLYNERTPSMSKQSDVTRPPVPHNSSNIRHSSLLQRRSGTSENTSQCQTIPTSEFVVGASVQDLDIIDASDPQLRSKPGHNMHEGSRSSRKRQASPYGQRISTIDVLSSPESSQSSKIVTASSSEEDKHASSALRHKKNEKARRDEQGVLYDELRALLPPESLEGSQPKNKKQGSTKTGTLKACASVLRGLTMDARSRACRGVSCPLPSVYSTPPNIFASSSASPRQPYSVSGNRLNSKNSLS